MTSLGRRVHELRHCGREDEHAEHEHGPEGGLLCIGTAREYAGGARARFRPFVQSSLAPPEVTWGATLCVHPHCAELAACRLEGWPYCLGHADDLLERELAGELSPSIGQLLPPLDEWAP